MTDYEAMLEKARWNEHGDSINVAGSAADAYEWLRQVKPKGAENERRLDMCKAALCRHAAEAS